MAERSDSYPADAVLLSDVVVWIAARAAMTPPFYLEGSAEAILRDAIQTGHLTVFDLEGRMVTAGRLDGCWHELVASRTAVLQILPEPVPQPQPSFPDYTLLWDAADRMAREDHRSRDWHWLRLMDAFLCGELSTAGMVYFFPEQPVGRGAVSYNRDQIGWILCGPDTEITPDLLTQLKGWSVADYQKQATYGDYFKPDPAGRCGLAVLTADIDAWRDLPMAHKRETTPIVSSAPSKETKRDKEIDRPSDDVLNRWLAENYTLGENAT